jgi:hypothetical protein
MQGDCCYLTCHYGSLKIMVSDFKERFFDKRRFSIMGEAASACGYM